MTLFKFYKAHGIRYRNGKAIYRAEAAKSVTIKKRRNVFSKLLATLVATHKPIIYCDETTFNSWMMKAKSWAHERNSLLHARNSKRLSVTVYGAFGNCMNNPVFKMGGTTNRIEFIEFMREVKEQVKAQYQGYKPILLYDGAKAHTCKDSMRLMK